MKKLYHGNLKLCQPKNLLVLPLLIIIILHQLNGTKFKFCSVFKGSSLKQKNATSNHPSIIVSLIVYESDACLRELHFDFTSKNCLFGGAKLAKNADPDKYVYTDYNIGLDSCSKFSLPDCSVGKNAIIFGVHMSSSVHIDNKKILCFLAKV